MNIFDGQYIDPVVQEPLRAAMRREDPLWFTTGKPRITDHPADRGGLTCGGITAKRWGQYQQLGRPATREELAAITVDQALKFYYLDYVIAPKWDWIPDQRLRSLCIDWSFTSGPDDPWRAVQASLKSRGHYPSAPDGIPGPKTRQALMHDGQQRELYKDVLNARIRFYLALALNDTPTRNFMVARKDLQLHNLRGWINRCLEFTL